MVDRFDRFDKDTQCYHGDTSTLSLLVNIAIENDEIDRLSLRNAIARDTKLYSILKFITRSYYIKLSFISAKGFVECELRSVYEILLISFGSNVDQSLFFRYR